MHRVRLKKKPKKKTISKLWNKKQNVTKTIQRYQNLMKGKETVYDSNVEKGYGHYRKLNHNKLEQNFLNDFLHTYLSFCFYISHDSTVPLVNTLYKTV